MDSREIINKIKKLREEKILQDGGYTNPQPYTPYENPFSFRQDVQSVVPQGFSSQGLMPINSLFPENQSTITDYPQANIQYNDTYQNRLYNPYGGLNLEGALFNLGRSLSYDGDQQGWNAARGIASAGKLLTGGARTLFAGAANQNATQNTYNSYIDRLYNTAPTYQYGKEGGYMGLPIMQEGGLTNAAVATGAYVVGNENVQGNVEVEGGEIIQDMATGQVAKVVGDTHEQGGVEAQLPPSKVLSDHTKIGAKNAKQFREDFEIKVKATDTFAAVMDKYNTKIGWKDIVEEEESTIEEIGNQEQSDISADTKDLNLNFLSNKLQELQAQKEAVLPIQDEAFNKVFDRQEMIPKKGQNDSKMQQGGMFDSNIMGLSEAYGVPPERVYEMLQQIQSTPVMQAGGFFTPSQYAQQQYGQQSYLAGTTNAAGIEDEAQVLARLQAQNQALPYLIRQSGIYSDNAGAFPNLNNTAAFQQAYDNYVNKTIPEIDANPFLSEEQKAQYKQQAQSQLLGISNQNGQYDAIYGQETSSRTNFNLPYLTAEDKAKYGDLRFLGDVIDTETGQIKPEYDALDPKTKELILGSYGRGGQDVLNIGLDIVNTPTLETIDTSQQDTTQVNRNITQLSNANLPVDFILPPTGAQPVLRQQANLSRLDAVKQTVEPSLANIQAQTDAAIQATSFLPDSQRAAVIANLLGTAQQGANQVIGQVEGFNTQSQAQINQYNAQQADKEQLLNFQLDNDYQNKIYATLNNTQMDISRYFQDLNNQNNFNYNFIDRRNLLNQMTPQYFNNGSGEVAFQNTAGSIFGNANPSSIYGATYSTMTPEQKKEYEKTVARNIANSKTKKR